MNHCKRILIVADQSVKPIKFYIDQMPKLAKGFIRLGHDARIFGYSAALARLSPFKSRRLSSMFYKQKVDALLCRLAREYQPDLVYISFAKYLDAQTIQRLRESVPAASFVGGDGDPWPSHEIGRIETAKELDLLLATNNGSFLDEYRQAGVKKGVFLPNMIDPDLDYRYKVASSMQSDILWTGTLQHSGGHGDPIRERLIRKISQLPHSRIYGCLGQPKVEGLNYLHAISGAKIGIHCTCVNNVSMCHSDRITQYIACGTLVLAKRVPDTNLLFKDGAHCRYFDTVEECLGLIDYYLKHEDERIRIADAGMCYCHEHYNSQKIAGHILDLLEHGKYTAAWGTFS